MQTLTTEILGFFAATHKLIAAAALENPRAYVFWFNLALDAASGRRM